MPMPEGPFNKRLEIDTMKRQDFRLAHRLRVRWVEVDLQQIVFNGHYLMYFDTAVTEYWRRLAMPYAATMHQLGGDLYVKKAEVQYHASAEMDDFLEVCLRCDRIGRWQDLQKLASPLRTEVFVHEQKVPAELEWDEADDTALHCVAVNRMGLALATGRLLVHAPGVGRIGRMAVKKPLRGSDLGARVLQALMNAARDRGDSQVVLHAQCRRAGFAPHGPIFEEAGIAHIEMVRDLQDR
jgi:YbgC/YbaW family acyl-CoA thioester hydrolase